MSEAGLVAVMVAIITGVPGVIAAVLANRSRQHARAARVQVENDHTTNLREEGDSRHTESTRLQNLTIQLLMDAKKDIRGLRYDISRLTTWKTRREGGRKVSEDTNTPATRSAKTDAAQRSIRTLVQGLAIDALVAAGAAATAVLSTMEGDDLLAGASWIVLGTSVLKSVLTAVASYVARLKVPPA